MITTPLVLVLGAGASYPYGFPLGNELKTELCNIDNDVSYLRKSLVKHANLDDVQLRSFSKSFRLSGIKSIDAFLAKRAEFSTIGKIAIAGSLLSKNNNETLIQVCNDDWYQEVWNALQSGITNVNDLKENNIRIITFNYDYSLESFLHQAIVHTFGVTNAEAFLALQQISIMHVYGCIKNIDTVEALINETVINEQSLLSASNNIKVIPESRDTDDSFTKARKWFDWSSNICFLGFGFDELNIKRLNIKSVLDYKIRNGSSLPHFIASTFGMTRGEQELARNRLGLSTDWHTQPHKSLYVIREHIEIFN